MMHGIMNLKLTPKCMCVCVYIDTHTHHSSILKRQIITLPVYIIIFILLSMLTNDLSFLSLVCVCVCVWARACVRVCVPCLLSCIIYVCVMWCFCHWPSGCWLGTSTNVSWTELCPGHCCMWPWRPTQAPYVPQLKYCLSKRQPCSSESIHCLSLTTIYWIAHFSSFPAWPIETLYYTLPVYWVLLKWTLLQSAPATLSLPRLTP